MAKHRTRSVLSALFSASMMMGLTTPAIAQTETAEENSRPKNEIYFDEPVSEGTASGNAGSIGNVPDANKWQQLSLPIGNSLMGANIFGEYNKERITFNQKTVWNGGPSTKRPNYNGGNKTTINGKPTAEFYQDVVNAFKTNASNKDSLAGQLVGENNGGYGSYQLLGDIYMDFDLEKRQAAWDEYMASYWLNGTEIIDDRDESITYKGWSNWDKSGWHNNTEKFTETAGSELTMNFTGEAIRMIGCTNGYMGKIDVYLDGELALENVDLKVGGGDGSILFELAELENKEHSLRIVNKVHENGGAKVSYDYFLIKKENVAVSEKIVDLNPNNKDTTGVQYSSDWAVWSRSGDSDGASWVNQEEMYVNNSTSNTSIIYTFTGTGIALFGAKNGDSGANMGDFTWSVDGSEPQTVNCVRTEAGIQRMELFSKTGLEEGEHTVEIKGVNKKLSFDNFVVYGTSTGEAEVPAKPESPANYKRWLDIDESVAGVVYDRDNTHYVREYIASHPDNVIAMQMSAEGEKTLDFDFSLPMALEGDQTYGKTTTTTANISEDKKTADLYIAGQMNDNEMKLATRANLSVDEGTIEYDEENKCLKIRNTENITIFVSAATDYEDNYPTYRTGETDAEVMARVDRDVNGAIAKGYAKVKEDHIADYTNIYDRVALDFGQTNPNLTTDELLKKYNSKDLTESERRYLEVLLFQYGRYLQISSTRENAEGREDQDLPANLQGVWSIYTGPTGNVPWASDYHMNVNMQMNYWPTYNTNMAECALPMIDYEDGLREPGRVTASTYFGIDNSNGQQNGYTAHTQNTPFGWTCPGWSFDWGWSPAAVPWMLQNVYEYYEYTQDTEFLRNNIFPMMREQAKTYEHVLTEVTYANGKKRLATVPAYSSEHGPRTAGNVYENTLAWQLFNDCTEAALVLNAEDPEHPVVDEETLAKWADIMEKLDPIEVGASGQIKEWYDETTLGSVSNYQMTHRHMSHLLGLFPGDLINADNPEYLAPARVSLEARGDDATGWGMGQRLNSWARVKDGNHAMDLIESLFRGGMYSNLWDAHPPFQIDGNFGYTAGVAEMLMQSNASTIELLPAMPDEWTEGRADGLLARGNFELDLNWSNSRLDSVEVIAKNGGTCKLTNSAFTGAESVYITDSNGNTVTPTTIDGHDNALQFETTKGETYTVTVLEKAPLQATFDIADELDLSVFKDAGKDDFIRIKGEADSMLKNSTSQTAINEKAVELNNKLLALRRKVSPEALDELK